MKAAKLYAAGDLRVEDIPAPGKPVPGSVLLNVLAAGICGSDIHNYRTGQWLTDTPRVAGHEFAALVVEAAGDAPGFTPGDLVVADSRYWCGECENCRTGRRNLCKRLGFVGEVCDGGFAPFAVLPERLLVKAPGDLDPVAAAMAEPLAVALHAIRRLRVPNGQPVLVAGCGPIGGLIALLLSRLHDGPILIADRNAARLDLVAAETGAEVCDLEAGASRVRHAFDATGSVAVVEGLVKGIDGGGGICLVGISHGAFPLDPNLLVEREIALIGSHAFADELPEAVGMLRDLSSSLLRFVDREYEIGDTVAAYQRAIRGEATGLKMILRPA
jgi:(R,R)-butanediol dehydrogenase/meso-butanediol dehydrogenase/diacetyl reductase